MVSNLSTPVTRSTCSNLKSGRVGYGARLRNFHMWKDPLPGRVTCMGSNPILFNFLLPFFHLTTVPYTFLYYPGIYALLWTWSLRDVTRYNIQIMTRKISLRGFESRSDYLFCFLPFLPATISCFFVQS